MKPILAVVAAAALAVITSLVGFRMGDRSLLASPPEAVAEAFARNLAGGRISPAAALLAPGTKRVISADSLARVSRSIREHSPAISVESKLRSMADSAAAATATIEFANGSSVKLSVDLSWDLKWQISHLALSGTQP